MRPSFTHLGLVLVGAAFGASLAGGCGGTDGSGTESNFGGGGGVAANGGGGSGNGGGSAAAGGGIVFDGGFDDSAINPAAACDLQKYEATLVKKPVDIIFIVDNSCSMTNEVAAIEQNISTNFSSIIGASGIDYRVIMIAEQGPNGDESLCIGPPLGAQTCPIAANQPTVQNPPLFFHYDNNDVESHDSWCKMINWYDKPDRYAQAPGGWRIWLRPEAFKTFVEITDDGVSCTAGTWSYNDADSDAAGLTAAQKFDADLMARDPAQFGSAADRNYVWHSIIGVTANTADPTKAYHPADPIQLSLCTTAVDPGTGYQHLSKMTGGLRFPVCEGLGYDVVFKKIAEGVIKGAQVACDFPMPQPPAGKELDPSTIKISYTPGGGGSPAEFSQVANAAACTPNAFYIEGNQLKLCPGPCATVKADSTAKIEILALCKGSGPN